MSFFTTMFGGASTPKIVTTATTPKETDSRIDEEARARRVAAAHRQGTESTILAASLGNAPTQKKQLLGE